MTFTEQQVEMLNAKLDGSRVKERDGFSYIEGWFAIHEANRIFGHGEWDSEVVDLKCVISTQQGQTNYTGRDREGYIVAYVASVKVTVRHDGGESFHEDVGYGEGINYSNVGQAHESASKEAVTDALKRALKNWGNPFGLTLYDKAQEDVERAPVDYGFGVCPEHGVPYRQSEKQREMGYAPSHKQGDGWCQKQDLPDIPDGRFDAPEGSLESEVKRMLSDKFHDEVKPTRDYVKEITGQTYFKDLRTADYQKLYDDLVQGAPPVAEAAEGEEVQEYDWETGKPVEPTQGELA